MDSESGSASHDDRGIDEEEEYEAGGGGNRLLGFMFGNLGYSGEVDADYFDEDAKEHLDALADKLGPSLADIALLGKSPHAPAAASATTEEDYDEKAENAIDYEDIDEQYEGPEIEAATEEDHLLPKGEYFSADVSVATLGQKSSIFDDENYDEDEGYEKESETRDKNLEASDVSLSLVSKPLDEPETVDNDSECQAIMLPERGDEDSVVLNEDNFSNIVTLPGRVDAEIAADLTSFQKESAVCEDMLDAKNSSPLPILCIEDGMAILRFSEIFGIHEPPKRPEKREHRYSVYKDKYTSVAVSQIAEDDDEAFLRGSHQFFLRKPSKTAHDDAAVFFYNNSEFEDTAGMDEINLVSARVHDARKHVCMSAEPMRESSTIELSSEWHSEMSPRFYPLDQQDWETKIIWGNSPSVSENSMESCELSGPEGFESVVNQEMEMRPPDHQSDYKIRGNTKDFACHAGPISYSVEPFGSQNKISSPESQYHPRLLRLESWVDRDTLEVLDTRKEKEILPEEKQKLDFLKRFKQLTFQNHDLADGSWLDNVVWDPEKPIMRPKLIFDLQDEQMVFETFDDKDYEYLHSHAGAMITTQSGTHGFGLVELPGHISLSGGRFNIANDKFYSNRKASPQLKSLSKKRAAHGVKILHSIPGLKLQTVKTKLSNKDVANFHRPKALWYPHDNEVAAKQQERLPTQGPMKIILKSLGGKGSKIHVDAEETVSSIKVKASKKLDFRLSERVKIFYSGKDLEDNRTLSEQNVRPNSLLHLIRTKIHLLPVAQKLPSENKSLRPPGAFKKKSDLSVKDGHVFLMEYCEERPLLLGNPGMGARLCTYYQKSAPDDQNGDTLRNTNTSLGTVLTLEPTDKSPFLGDIKPGFFQSSLETNMYRAPIFPHKVSSTDYLLVRSAKGKLSIRRIERIHVVGQQEPHMEVMSPAAKGLQTYMVNRLLVYMYREFRAAEKRGTLPCIRADEISVQFPNISEPFLRKRLKHCVDLQRGSNGQLSWVMRANFHIPPEEELRRMVTPESVCAYESMQAGLYRLKRLGIIRLAHLTGPNQLAALSSAMNQLPDEAIALAAASHIERELQITPWNLSSNFVACTGQNRENIERLEIAGVGDPSGRGLGFSYVRVAPKGLVSNAMVKKKPAVVKGTTVTGTDADLRRLSMDAAREVLLKFNIPEEQIAKLTRWHRIAMIRKLSSEQTASGVEVDPTTISKYARGQRMSFLQLQQQTREKCREIWDRQVQSLSAIDGDENECDSEPNSDLDSFAGDLENLLDAEECEGEESNLELENEKSDGVRGLKMRKHPSEAPPEEVIEDEAAEAAELCKLLMDDDEAQCKKKKARPMADEPGFAPIPQANLGFENTERAKKSSTMGSHIVGPLTSTGPFFTKQKADLTEVGNFLPKMTIPGKVKPSKKNEPLPASLLNKKVKIMTDGVKVFKEKKSARESFVCGACGQLGHMRTNKNCPKYGEDPEMQVNNTAPEKSSAKTTSLDPLIQADLRPPPKKLIPKTTTTTKALPEPPDGETSSSKAKVLKVICASVDKTPDKVTPFPTRSSEQLSTSETDTGDRQFPKVSKIKITNKVKGDENQAESHKPNIVIRPPTELVKESAPKKIIIKQPKETNNLYQSSLESPGIEFKKTKMMNELTGSETSKKQQESIRVFEEEKMTNMEILGEERSRRTREEEIRMPEEQERVAALRIYEEAIRREREEEERQKAQKKKKKKKSVEVNDDYMEDYWARRNSRWNPERERSAKRKSVELGRYSGDYGQPIKRRKGGEVGLANILEGIIETLKGRYDVSYLFLKPVSKKEAPDYLDIVKHPMDLSTIREKIRRLEYKNRDEFRQDVWQITYNAHLYNDGRNPGIPPLADQLLEICDYLLDENDESLTEAEAGIDDRD